MKTKLFIYPDVLETIFPRLADPDIVIRFTAMLALSDCVMQHGLEACPTRHDKASWVLLCKEYTVGGRMAIMA